MAVDVNQVTITELATKVANLSIEVANGVGINQFLQEQLNEAHQEIHTLRAMLDELNADIEAEQASVIVEEKGA